MNTENNIRPTDCIHMNNLSEIVGGHAFAVFDLKILSHVTKELEKIFIELEKNCRKYMAYQTKILRTKDSLGIFSLSIL
ncbi:hypothetical protein [Rhodoferax sp.]|uniref:hypothetical protein n=1 Tax=Rhodoferax sp. TaxID=50421 RepID=UPI0025D087AD|nr:hypothetical protein [Rhodoferax sp.]